MRENKRLLHRLWFCVFTLTLLFVATPLTLWIPEVGLLPELYRLIIILFLMLCILVIAVSYITGQAKIDIDAKAILGEKL